MKIISFLLLMLPSIFISAQDSIRVVEPMETSTQNYDLLIMAVVALVILIALYFIFRRTRTK